MFISNLFCYYNRLNLITNERILLNTLFDAKRRATRIFNDKLRKYMKWTQNRYVASSLDNFYQYRKQKEKYTRWILFSIITLAETWLYIWRKNKKEFHFLS